MFHSHQVKEITLFKMSKRSQKRQWPLKRIHTQTQSSTSTRCAGSAFEFATNLDCACRQHQRLGYWTNVVCWSLIRSKLSCKHAAYATWSDITAKALATKWETAIAITFEICSRMAGLNMLLQTLRPAISTRAFPPHWPGAGHDVSFIQNVAWSPAG